MSLTVGTRIGAYEIVAPIGAGGMGEVYRARDPRLNRDIAIKILHASVATDAERLRRFTTEAQAVAALNHPNVLTIHEVGTHEGHPFLATELLEGETLRARLDSGALPVSKAIDFARQTAAGLAAAHARGIAHRDIKPENLFITTDGRLKILDFGLAKDVTTKTKEDATRLQSATSAGTILGTVGYMSPEQVRAQPVDHRTDLFSLGIVIYEMVSGHRPFAGDSAVETMNAILTVDPPEIALSGRALPPGVSQVVRHCLEKNPEERFQSARDLSFALQALAGSSEASVAGLRPSGVGIAAPAHRRSPARWLAPAAIGIVGLIIGAAAMRMLAPREAGLDLGGYRFTPLATDAEPESVPVWSHDGRSIAYLKGSQIFVRTLETNEATPVTTANPGATQLFWFPDDNRIGFVSASGVWSISRAGGDPERLQDGVALAATLSPDGKTLAFFKLTTEGTRRTGGLWFASPPTAPANAHTALANLASLIPAYLEYSPDGKRLAYSGFVPEPGVWLMAVESGGAGPATRLFTNVPWSAPSHLSWMPDSHTLLLTNLQTSEQQGMWLADVDRGTLTKITAGVEHMDDASVSPDGRRIAFASGAVDFDLIEIPLGNGPVTSMLATARDETSAVWTRAGEMAYITDKSGRHEIRLRRTADGTERLIVGPASFPNERALNYLSPSISPDGTRVLFTTFDGTHGVVWVAPVNGGAPVRVGAGTANEWMSAWSPDGKEVVYATSEGGNARLLKRRLGSSDPPQPLIDAIPTLFGCLIEWSPAGDWIAHDSPEGLSLVSPDGKSRRVLMKERALAVAWSGDSRTLFALSRGTPTFVTSIDVRTGQTRLIRRLDDSILPRTPYNPGLRLALNADGTRLLTTVARERSDLWVLER